MILMRQRRVFKKYGNKIAACIIEPVAANMGVILPRSGYLRSLRRLCSDNKSLLIFDEVITGFRLCFGGAEKIFKVRPDLTCLGKIIGGGLPAAAVGGRAEIMNMLAPTGRCLSGRHIERKSACHRCGTCDTEDFEKQKFL